uniref:Uncharacterized protein n=1 Tax=Arundo donax TaxID=35708 RepID=A0A0A9A6Q2_ARUDO
MATEITTSGSRRKAILREER